MRKLDKKDIIIISIITIIYGIISFINLGGNTNPQTFWHIENINENIVLEFKESNVGKIRHYTGPNFGTYELYISNNGTDFTYLENLEQTSVFSWADLQINEDFKYLKIVGKTVDSYLGDIAVYDQEGDRMKIIAKDENAKLIVDEPETIPKKISFMNSSYFDEIYHPRSAYEYVHGLDIYEWTHPPLGKLIIAIPVAIMGMTPLSYRLMGNIT